MKKIIILIALAAVVVGAWIALRRGVRVEVRNVGSAELTDVVVKVAGATHELGVVAPGAGDSVRVDPTGTTKLVELTWKSGGRASYGKHEVFFEDSGYNGTVRFTLDGITLTSAEDDIEPGFY